MSKLVIVSGPSGVGKGTVIANVLKEAAQPVVVSVSATTRGPRPGEIDGQDYYFLSDQEFRQRREAGEFLECFEVFGQGHWYGTLRGEVASSLQAGKWVILEIDVQGALKVLAEFGDAITIFVMPDSMQELERRLRSRGTETEEKIQKRLATAREELVQADLYQHQVVNDTVEQAVREICAILSQHAGA